MSEKKEIELMQKALEGVRRLARRRAKKYKTALVYEKDGKLVKEFLHTENK
jgi:hypothetical protein